VETLKNVEDEDLEVVPVECRGSATTLFFQNVLQLIKILDFMLFNNLAFFTRSGFFLDVVWVFSQKVSGKAVVGVLPHVAFEHRCHA